jgi:uncharacterized damage-inducible protein DinB
MASQQPASLFESEFLLYYDYAERRLFALAEAIPEELYEWRPAEGVKTLRELFEHIALSNVLQLKVLSGAPPSDLMTLARAMEEEEKKPAAKKAVIRDLIDSCAALREALSAVKDEELGGSIDFFGSKTTVRGTWMALLAHMCEHLGQAICYARMAGIKPPWPEAKPQ